MMSRTTSGGGSAAILASASSPSTAVVTSYPSRWRRLDSACRSVGLSSTTRARLFTIAHSLSASLHVHLLHGHPQALDEDVEHRAPLVAQRRGVEERAQRVSINDQHIEERIR